MSNFAVSVGDFEEFLCCQKNSRKAQKKTLLKFDSGYVGLKYEIVCSVFRMVFLFMF